MLDDLEKRLHEEITSVGKENQSLAVNIPKVLELKKEIDDTREHLDRINRNVRQPHDPARVAAKNHLDKLQKEYNDLWRSKSGGLATRLTPADDKDDDDKTEKARDAAERFQEQLQDLISKLG
jgi:uncharacterized coiled-coil DUF342 family protein